MRSSRPFLILLVVQSLALSAFLVWVGVLRLPVGTEEWHYRAYVQTRPMWRLLPAAAVVVVVGGLLAGLTRVGRAGSPNGNGVAAEAAPTTPSFPTAPPLPRGEGRGEGAVHSSLITHHSSLAVLAAGIVALQLALWYVYPNHLETLVGVQTSDVSAGYLSEAYRIDDPGEFLHTYAGRMPDLPQHLSTHPPGAVLYFYAVRRALETVPGLSDWIGGWALRLGGTSSETVFMYIRQFPGTSDLPLQSEGERRGVIATAVCSAVGLGACGALACVLMAILIASFPLPRGEGRSEGAVRSSLTTHHSSLALLAAIAAGLTPCVLLFFQSLDQLLLLLCVGAVFCVWRWPQRGRSEGPNARTKSEASGPNGAPLATSGKDARPTPSPWGLIAAGILLSIALFVSLGSLLIVALVALIVALSAWSTCRSELARDAVAVDAAIPSSRHPLIPILTGWGLLGVGLLPGFFGWLALGVHPWEIVRGGLHAHAGAAGLASHRTYTLWVWMNVVEVAIFLGLPLTVLAAFPLARYLRDLVQRRCSLAGIMLISSLICLLLLTLSGIVRGETGRLLMFMIPALAAGAVTGVWNHRDEAVTGRRGEILAMTFALLGVQLAVMALVMQPIATPY